LFNGKKVIILITESLKDYSSIFF